MEQYNSAEEAFNSLNIGIRFEKIPCRHALKKIFEILDIEINIRNPSLSDLVLKLCNSRRWRMGGKSLKIGMTINGDIIILSDVYDYLPQHKEVCENIVNIANNNNINIEMFEKSYGRLEVQNSFYPPANTKWYCEGYSKFYRGILVGLIIHS